MKTLPDGTLVLTLKVDKYAGAGVLAASIQAPDGYRFDRMEREGEQAEVFFKPETTT
jgi:hypothetical protein